MLKFAVLNNNINYKKRWKIKYLNLRRISIVVAV